MIDAMAVSYTHLDVYKRQRIERPMQPHEVDQRDWSEIENLEKGGPIAIADYFIINDGSLEQLHQKIDAATHDAHFCKSPEQC